MKSFFSLTTFLAVALIGLVVAVPFHPALDSQRVLYQLELKLKSDSDAYVQIYFDTGSGMSEPESVRLPVDAGSQPRVFRFPMPVGVYRDIRIDPTDRSGTVEFSDVRVVDRDGKVLRELPATDFVATNQIAQFVVEGNRVRLTTTPGSTDCIVTLRHPLTPPIDLRPTTSLGLAVWVKLGAYIAAALCALLAVIGFFRVALARTSARILEWSWANPVRAVWVTALAAVILSAYPVVFFGKSFVSPNYGTSLLYDGVPTLPGIQSTATNLVADADVGAIMWQHIPISVSQHRALFQHGELPLWDRYNLCGAVMLGQGQLCFGDPLHLIAILGGGSAWSWDLKYLLARLLFAAGLGLIAWHGFRHLPAALVVVCAAPFVGHFVYRVNHPAIFSLCYAPWVLLAWIRVVQATQLREAVLWGAGLVIANLALLASGTVKEAYMLLLGTSLTGLVYLGVSALPVRQKVSRLMILTLAEVTFLLISAPLWLTLLGSLMKSYTSYDLPLAYQLQPGAFLGLFDELFFRVFMDRAKTMNPSMNLLLGLGVLWSWSCFSLVWSNRLARALFLGSMVSLAIAFGVVPGSLIAKIPFLANILHIDNCFLCVAIVQLSALSAFGFSLFFSRIGTPEGKADLNRVVSILLVIVALFVGTTHAVQRGQENLVHWQKWLWSPMIGWYLCSLLVGSLCVLLAARYLAVTRRPSTSAVLFLVFGITLLLWRLGQHSGVGLQHYVVTPMERADFSAESPAIEHITARAGAEPFRAVGIEGNLFPGWSAVYGIESICGPDALMNKSYRELMAASGVDRQWDWRYVIHSTTIKDTRPILDFLNVRFYLEIRSDRALLSQALRPVGNWDLDVYESPSVWPRAFFTDRVAVYRDLKDFVGWIRYGDGRPLAAVRESDWLRLSPTPPISGDTPTRTVNPARNYQLTNNRTAFSVDATGPGFIVLQEVNVNHEFRVTVNGAPAECLRLNHAFKGVYVPKAGSYEVAFSYWPEHFTLALTLCALGFAFLVVSIATAWKILPDTSLNPVPS